MRFITNITLTALAVLSVGIAEKSATAMTAPTPENRLTCRVLQASADPNYRLYGAVSRNGCESASPGENRKDYLRCVTYLPEMNITIL